MKWDVRHEPKKSASPWSVYACHAERDVYETGFASEEEAKAWVAAHADDKEETAPRPAGDEVVQDSAASFPASDPPGWINHGKE